MTGSLMIEGDNLCAAPIELGSATDFAVLAGSGITISGAINSTVINGDIGSAPTFSITGLENAVFVTGVNHGGNAVTVSAKASLLTAYNNAAGQTATVTYTPITDLGGQTLFAGVHFNSSSFDITGMLTLDALGDPNAVWIFQMGSTLTTASNSLVNLINGALASNVFWQVGSSATLGSDSDFAGSILAFTSITVNDGASVQGRLLALNGAVTLLNNTIVVVRAPAVVDSVEFDGGGTVVVTDTLVVASGIFDVASGTGNVSGGTVITPGDLHKVGAGELVTDSFIDVGGTAYVDEGALYVNGTLKASAVNVLPNALLGGTGLIIGDVHNAGTVAPGDHGVGTFTIDGDYTQTPQGTLQIEISGDSSFDQLIVTGTASLSGTLDVLSLGNYSFEYGQQYPFLVAGNIIGSFDEILMPNSDLYRGRFIIEDNVGILLVAPASYTLVAETPNQTRVAIALDEWIGVEDGDIGEVTLALDVLTTDQYEAAFEAIMPSYYASAISTGIELSQTQGQLLSQQLGSRRLGNRRRNQAQNEAPAEQGEIEQAGGKGARSVQPSGGKNARRVQYAEQPILLAPGPLEDETRWNVWMQGTGMFSEGGMSLTPGESFESGEFMIGADYALSQHLSIGLFTSYQEGWGDYDNGGSIDLETVRLGAYATVDFEGFYAHGAAGYGQTDYSIHRPIQWATLDRTATSNPDGSEVFFMLGTGYDFHAGNFTFGPAASIQYTRLKLNGFTERGADSLNLQVDDTTAESLRTYIGGRVAYACVINEGLTLVPELRMFWQHEFMQGGDTIHSTLDSGNGPGFDYLTEEQGSDSLYAGAGVSMLLGSNVTISLYYHANIGRNDDTQHLVTAGLNWKF